MNAACGKPSIKNKVGLWLLLYHGGINASQNPLPKEFQLQCVVCPHNVLSVPVYNVAC